MSLEEELQQVRREQKLALQAAQEQQRKVEEHRARIRRAILAQRSELVDQWSEIVTALLDETARATWGEDAYTMIEPDPTRSLTWAVVRQQGKAKLNYQVSLHLTEVNPDGLTVGPTDPLVTPIGFEVSGAENFPAGLSEQALRESLVSVFKSGPKDGGLDNHAEAVLAKNPYKEGEYEAADWKIIIPTIISLLVGLQLLGSRDTVLLGLLMTGLSVGALSITKVGQRFKRLESWQKALAVVAVIPGVCVGGFIILGVIALLAGLAGAAEKEQRVSEIEEGVRRTLR